MSRLQCLQFVQKWGASRSEVNLINPENPWYGSEDRLVWFCNFFFADITQKIKIKKWFQKWFLTPGTHSNPLITLQDQEGPDTRKPWSTQSNLRTSLRSYIYSVYNVTGCFRIKGAPQRPAVKDISQKSPCETYIYINTHMHTYIHKWTSCMAFKLWNLYTHAYIHT